MVPVARPTKFLTVLSGPVLFQTDHDLAEGGGQAGMELAAASTSMLGNSTVTGPSGSGGQHAHGGRPGGISAARALLSWAVFA